MSIRHKPEDWLKVMDGKDDLATAKFLLRDLTHYFSGRSYEDSDIQAVLALLTAIRLDQVAKS